ncbi:ParB N-terminal domain-containing protein [Deinococcus sp. MIMF12]|uniref:ParB N-terminal domain-containing protein n=1 Tax=Deinococcus rhizophilus TaxID=3049544 RepID=A0ABT7JC09_9DEIO|nr:ParB N-terminal domain-containing protein [Deinococcus rhizophilus]MDL2342576.1 ParB N-terminal domain-containing protein [Deinococcus rhizophilus]
MKHGRDAQPLSVIEWVHRDDLYANNYNPNYAAKPEMELLKTSIVEDGWTQPLVARPDGEIVDGFHRWTCSGDPRIYAMTGGYVPVVRLLPPAVGDQMLSTIRHNRARGEHGVLKMAEIVRRLIDEEGMTPEQVMQRCGMEKEEVTRLYDRGGMTERGTQGKTEFSRGWSPKV